MNKIKISVIIPVYNVEKYLSKCLNSIINQTLKDIEIICVDDCSTDKSLNVLENFSRNDNRFKTIKLSKNSKQGAARNKGLDIAQGKYITFVDADDFLETDFLEKTYNIAEETNCDIVITNIRNFLIENSKNNIKQLQTTNNDYKTLSLETGLHKYYFNSAMPLRRGPVAKLYKKEIIDKYKIRFPEKLIQEDEAFYWFYMLRVKNLYYLNEDLYNRLIHSSSVMYNLKYRYKNCLDHLKIIKIIYSYLKNNGKLLRYKNKFKSYVCHIIEQQPNVLLKYIYLFSINFYINILFDVIAKPLKQELFILKKIKQNKDKKILFWGASLFLKNFLKKYKIKNPNIIGIIDKDSTKHGTKFSNYTVYSPEDIENLEPDIIIISIINFGYERQKSIKKNIKSYYNKNIKIINL